MNNLATTTPKSLVFDPLYWWNNQKDFSIAIIITIIVFGILSPFNFPRLDFMIIISVVITIVMFYGIWQSIKSLLLINVEHAIAYTVRDKSNDYLSRVMGKEIDKMDLERVEGIITPSTSPEFSSSIVRLIQQIIADAKDRKYESIDVVTRPYKDETYSNLSTIQDLQQMSLRLGILGTFIGLIIAFSNLDLGNMEQAALTKSLNAITKALQFSFSTSISGLFASIVLTVLMNIIRRKQEKYFQIMEEMTHSVVSLARKSINKDEFLASFEQLRVSLEEVRNSVNDQQGETKVQTRVLEEGMNKLKFAKTEFDGFLQKMLLEVKDVYSILSPEAISQELKERLEKSTEGVAETLNNNLSNNLAEYDRLNENLNLLASNMNSIDSMLNQHFKSSNVNVEKTQKQVVNAVDDMGNLLRQFTKEVKENNTVELVGKEMKKLSNDVSNTLSSPIKSFSKQVDLLNTTLRNNSGNQVSPKAIMWKVFSPIITIVAIFLFLGLFRKVAPIKYNSSMKLLIPTTEMNTPIDSSEILNN